MEIKVGEIIKIKDKYEGLFRLIGLAVSEKPMMAAGKVVAVDPSNEEIRKYPELNPFADGEGELIYYDQAAGRHFIIGKHMVEPVLD